tara:strand:- start:29 stop:772 length:744 start_codon:yes stop_codon:yes gene_type:complete
MSIFFPVGERFFIDSVRHYRDRVTDPQLQEAVKGFMGQEAMHGREHDDYNDALTAKGMPADKYENIVLKLLNFFRRFTPKGSQLAGTIALEHLTAILAHRLLSDKSSMAQAEPRYAALWQWHALEETEHKAVAFDVYANVMKVKPLAYLRRCVALVLSTFIFFVMLTPFYIGLVRREKGQLFNLKGWWQVTVFLWGPRGVLLRALPDWFDFFKPGFHPWDHDNREFLSEIDDLVVEVEGYGAQGATA